MCLDLNMYLSALMNGKEGECLSKHSWHFWIDTSDCSLGFLFSFSCRKIATVRSSGETVLIYFDVLYT